MKQVYFIEQIEKGGKFLWFGKEDSPDKLDIARLNLPEWANAKTFISIQWSLLALALIGISMAVFNIPFGNWLASVSMVGYFGTIIISYRQGGQFEVKRPHNFREGQEVKIRLNKEGKIVGVTEVR